MTNDSTAGSIPNLLNYRLRFWCFCRKYCLWEFSTFAPQSRPCQPTSLAQTLYRPAAHKCRTSADSISSVPDGHAFLALVFLMEQPDSSDDVSQPAHDLVKAAPHQRRIFTVDFSGQFSLLLISSNYSETRHLQAPAEMEFRRPRSHAGPDVWLSCLL